MDGWCLTEYMSSRGLVRMAEQLNALEIAVVVETAGLNTSSTSVNHAMCTCTTCVRH